MKTSGQYEQIPDASTEERSLTLDELEAVSGGFSPAYYRAYQLERARRRWMTSLD